MEGCAIRQKGPGRNYLSVGRTVMNDFERRAAARDGLVVKVAYEVLVSDERFAKNLAAKYGASCEKTKDGWLVKKPIRAYSDDDPIVKAMKAAIEERG